MPLSAVNPDNYEALLAEKTADVISLLAPFNAPEPEVFPSPRLGYRMRAEFRMWHDGDKLDYVMFRKTDPRTPIPITTFPIAHINIQSLMPILLAALSNNTLLRRKLFQVEFLATTTGAMLITLIYHRKLESDWENAAEELRTQLAGNLAQPNLTQLTIVGRSRKQKCVLGKDYLVESLNIDGAQYTYRQYEQSFTQPNAAVNTSMLEWACSRASELPASDLLELYCGNGNFTLPLSRHFNNVIATEVAKSSARAARANLEENRIDNVQLVRLAAEEVTQAMQNTRVFRRLAELPKALSEFDLRAVFVDPPRAGLDDHTTRMVAGFDSILYISCNPHTLADNLKTLCQTHRIANFALFDQFPYTDHMECGVVLKRNTDA